MTSTRRVNAHTNLGTLQAGDVVLGERTSGTTGLFTVGTLGGISDGDKGDVTVSGTGTVITIDTPPVATVAANDKVLIKDTDASDVMKYVTAQSIADLAAGGVSSVNGETGAVTLTSDDISVAAQTNKFVTAANLVVLGNTSGTNSGDNATNTQYSGLAASKQDVITGLTADGTELNILDGATLSTIELNYVDGVTSAIQTQLNAKAASLGADDNYVTDAQLVVITNTSNTNTGDQLVFKTIAVSGQSDVVADTTTDTLTLAAGTNITITTNAGTDTITISASGGVTDVTSSMFFLMGA